MLAPIWGSSAQKNAVKGCEDDDGGTGATLLRGKMELLSLEKA